MNSTRFVWCSPSEIPVHYPRQVVKVSPVRNKIDNCCANQPPEICWCHRCSYTDHSSPKACTGKCWDASLSGRGAENQPEIEKEPANVVREGRKTLLYVGWHGDPQRLDPSHEHVLSVPLPNPLHWEPVNVAVADPTAQHDYKRKTSLQTCSELSGLLSYKWEVYFIRMWRRLSYILVAYEEFRPLLASSGGAPFFKFGYLCAPPYAPLHSQTPQ